MDYSDLNEETRLYINKAMEIYSVIENKKISRYVTKLWKKQMYEFTKTDKKVMAFFIAGLLSEGDIKKIFSQYDDIKLKDLLDFIGIKESDIIPLEDNQYQSFYDEKIQLFLLTTLYNKISSINFLTPAIIIDSLRYSYECKSEVLDFFSSEYNITGTQLGAHYHPIFNALHNYTLLDGSINNGDKSETHSHGSNPSVNNFFIKTKTNSNPSTQTKKSHEKLQLDDNLWQFLDEIKKKFIGQETLVEELFYNIVNNQELATMENVQDGERSIIFIDGPSGTGKTAITREITEKLGIPFISTPVTNYSATGYVGGDITDNLKKLYKKAADDLDKAQRGIIVLEEFDKLSYSRNFGSSGLEMKKAVQQQLLDFMGGGKYTIYVGNNIFEKEEIEFDTSKLTFVCLGALTDLRMEKIDAKQTIGFGQTNRLSDELDYNLSPLDLIEFGFEKEVVARFNTFLHTEDYSKQALEKILRESAISPILGFKKWVEAYGKELIIDDDVYGIIAKQAYDLNTGARSLQTIINSIRTPLIKEVLRGKDKTIYLDSKAAIVAANKITNRKGRG